MRVLVAEDEKDLADAVAVGLRREGYAVDVAYDGDIAAFVKARVYPYDLVCLDLNMPGLDGRDVCRRLRDDRGRLTREILMLTARDSVADRIGGLDDGADDYLVKPFHFEELKARIRAPSAPRARWLQHGPSPRRPRLDVARHEARRDGQPLGLSPKQLALLRYFMSHPAKCSLRDAFYARLGRERRPGDADRPRHRHDPAAQAGRPAADRDGRRARLQAA